MSTRSTIGIHNPCNDTVQYIYCHYDGYIEGVGATLHAHYQEQKKILSLIENGNASILGEEIGEPHDFNSHNDTNPSACLFYGRDRGEKNQEPKVCKLSEYSTSVRWNHVAEYQYLYSQGEWHLVLNSGTTTPLRYFCDKHEVCASL